MRHELHPVSNALATRAGLPVNDTYWKHYVDLATGQMHCVVDLQLAFAFQVGNDMIVTDRRTLEQVGRIPATPEPGMVIEQCACGNFHPER
jgi:hypothetical protein